MGAPKGNQNASKRKKVLTEEHRAKIKVAMILSRFHRCFEGELELSPQQIQVGFKLLDKAMGNPPVEIQQEIHDKRLIITDEPVIMPSEDGKVVPIKNANSG